MLLKNDSILFACMWLVTILLQTDKDHKKVELPTQSIRASSRLHLNVDKAKHLHFTAKFLDEKFNPH